MFRLFKTVNKEKELEGLKKAYEILEERYKKKEIPIEIFTKKCNEINKKIEMCKKN